VRVEERGVIGGDDEVDLAEQVERAAARHAVDRGDDRLPTAVGAGSEQPAGIVVGEGRELVLDTAIARDEVAVDARAERLVAARGEHHHVDRVVGADLRPDVGELGAHGQVERIEPIGAVQREPPDRAALLPEDRLVGPVAHRPER
jgi:hypothetical protein